MIESVLKPNTGLVGETLEVGSMVMHGATKIRVVEDVDERWMTGFSVEDKAEKIMSLAKSALKEA